MKKITLFLLLLAAGNLVQAQDTDSLRFSNIAWQKQQFGKEFTLYTAHLQDSSLFNSNQNLMYIELAKGKKSPALALAFDRKERIKTSDMATANRALAAVNGTFFDMKNGGSVCYLKVDGQLINENQINASGKRTFYQKSAVVINKGKAGIKQWDGSANWEAGLPDENIITTGPLLRLDDKSVALDSISFNLNRHPRTALGIRADGSTLLLVVDGRSAQSKGMSLFELSKVMRWLGCVDAVNMDGGGSSTMWIAGYGENGVVNYPSDNKQWDHEGQRKVANIIFIQSKAKQ